MATQDNIAPTDEEQAQADEAGQAAFDSSFEDNGEAPPPDRVPRNAKEAKADDADPSPAPAAAKKKEVTAPPPDEPIKDPFAGLSQEAREILAAVPTLRHQFDSLNGRYVALQRELASLKAAPAAPAAAPPAEATKNAKREAIRGELSEVAEALDELEQSIAAKAPTPAPPQEPAAPTATAPEPTQAERDLEEAHPGYVQKLGSSEFEMWLATLPRAEGDKIRSTGSALAISKALDKFDAHMAQAAAQREEAERLVEGRKNRVTSAAQPARGNARPAATNLNEDPEAAFQAGFNGP